MRGLAALLWKEVEHHALAVCGAWALAAAVLLVMVAVQLSENAVTLLGAAHSFAAFCLPVMALWLAGRLVVQEFTTGTHEFLVGLPVGPALRTAVRWVLGWCVLQVTLVWVIGAVALVAVRREGVPASFLLPLWAILATYLTAWHALAVAVAHTGRFRWLVWWLAFVALSAVDAPSELSSTWLGLVAEGADRIRLAPPLSAVGPTLAWAVVAGVATFAVATWRGGALLERWFRPATAEQRGRMIAVGVAAALLQGVLEQAARPPDGWELLPPAVDTDLVTVRAAASPGTALDAVAQDLGRELGALGAAVGVARWPPVVLLRAHPAPDEAPVARAPDAGPADQTVVILVDPTLPPREAVRRSLAVIVGQALGGQPDVDPDARFVAEGLAGWWIPEEAERDAALASLAPDGPAHDHQALAAALGPDVAAAVAAEGFRALEELGGRAAALAPAKVLLVGRWPGHGWPAVAPSRRRTGPGWISTSTGLDERAWRAAWTVRLSRRPPPEVTGGPALAIGADDGALRVTWDGPWPVATSLEWMALDPLQAVPVPGDPVRRAVPDPGSGSYGLPADPRSVVVARWVRTIPGLGRITGPWVGGT